MKSKVIIGLVLALVIGLIVSAAIILIEKKQIANLEREIRINQAHSVKHYLETDYIPGVLDQKTNDELSLMGENLWKE